jgi:hypothetical protein
MASVFRPSRSLLLASALGVCAGAGALLFACIVADPPAELPPPPQLPPSIVTGSVRPPITTVLTEWPPAFEVPVELSDTSLSFVWELFIDFDEFQNPQPVRSAVEPADPSAYDAGVRIIDIEDPPAPSRSGCHVVELLVALSFNGHDPHTPGPAGASSIVWFYNPNGDVGGCPTYDAGAAADGAPSPSDAAPDVVLLTDGGTE